ncbi:MAG TPA: DEAD/DEAH box helicase, partial [Chthonomonadales bacterium]|nr:DEAD/DEAH box helicase [Chthonomonadales bacterium]
MGSNEGRQALEGFREPVRRWFAQTFGEPTRAQELCWPAIRSGASTLLLAPTGSGKTLAAFLAAIDAVLFDPPPPVLERCRVLYISPLKALAVDVEKNLRAPVAGILQQAEVMGWTAHEPAVAIRTGDTPASERVRFVKRPADILITTPESLYLLLTSAARAALRSVRSVIVDEIHATVGTKRGAHLALSLERLQELTGSPLQRIGLSATQRPLEEVARFLGGFEDDGPAEGPGVETVEEGLEVVLEHAAPVAARRERPVRIVDAGARKHLDLRVESAAADLVDAGRASSGAAGASAADRRGVWPAIHPLLLDLIGKHRSTLIFVNSRRLAERLAASLNELAGSEVVHAHHGSIAREQRLQIEGALKAGRLPGLVATSSLELGIDMGAIDLVIQVEAPPGVASAMQRIGRAGHRIGDASKGVIIPRYRADLLACAAITERMHAGAVEPMRYPRSPLDVLAQQIVAMVAVEDWTVDGLERVVRRAAPYASLPRS